jgi:hypothetical protein
MSSVVTLLACALLPALFIQFHLKHFFFLQQPFPCFLEELDCWLCEEDVDEDNDSWDFDNFSAGDWLDF